MSANECSLNLLAATRTLSRETENVARLTARIDLQTPLHQSTTNRSWGRRLPIGKAKQRTHSVLRTKNQANAKPLIERRKGSSNYASVPRKSKGRKSDEFFVVVFVKWIKQVKFRTMPAIFLLSALLPPERSMGVCCEKP